MVQESYKFAFSNSSYDEADILVFGLPLEEGSERKEMERTPDKIREMSYRVYNPVYGNLSGKRISDIGNLGKEEIKGIGKRFVMLGGNHLSTFHALKSSFTMKNVKDVLIFDSHPDCFGEELNHASFVKFLSQDFQITMVGISNPAKAELEFMKENGIKWFSSKDVFWNFDKVRKSLPERAYVSIDMDVFMMNSGSYQAELMGLLPHQVFRLLEEVEILSADVVEATPEGAEAAARAVVELLGMM